MTFPFIFSASVASFHASASLWPDIRTEKAVVEFFTESGFELDETMVSSFRRSETMSVPDILSELAEPRESASRQRFTWRPMSYCRVFRQV